MTTNATIRIYVAVLADYVNGRLTGQWIDVTDPDTMQIEIGRILRTSKYPNVIRRDFTCTACTHNWSADADSRYPCPECDADGDCVTVSEPYATAEEWAVHDYDCSHGRLAEGEHPNLDELCELAEGIDEHGGAFLAFRSNGDTGDFEDAYLGEWATLGDYVAEFWDADDSTKAPDGQWWHPLNYVDWAKMGHDLEHGGDIWTAEAKGGGLWIFSNR